MEEWRGIGNLQITLLKNTLAQVRHEPLLKVVFISVSVALFWFGSLALFYRGLSFFHDFPIVGPALLDEAIYIFSAILFIMLALSSIIICFVTYYRSEEVAFLFSKPVDERVIFSYRFLQSVFFSSWAFLFLGLPFILAYGFIKTVPPWFYLFIVPYFVVFILLPAAFSSIIVLLAIEIIDHRKAQYAFFGALAGVSLVLFWYYRVHIGFFSASTQDVGYFLDNLLHHLRLLKHPFFPGYWMAKSLIGAAGGRGEICLFYFSSFAATTLLFLEINFFLAGRFFRSSWLMAQGGMRNRRYPLDRGLLNRCARCFSIFPRTTAALAEKDLKVFFRDFGQWSQFLIYFGILGIYIFNLRNLPVATESIYWKMIITFLNLSATALTLAGFTVRFLFPLISLEGTKIWILGLAPLTFRGLIVQKFFFNFIGVLCISELLMISTNLILKTDPVLLYISCGLAALVSIGLVGLALGLGSLYPDFKEDNPAKIVSGFGGTLNFVIALLYISVIIVIFAAPFFSYRIYNILAADRFHCFMVLSWCAALGITALVGILPLVMAYRRLDEREFT
ncbi:MAG: hypothetical protein JXO48_05990 [Deltaproteobacteria bacterium]|nr:hypothetical protein [Deltaproteobacteria bacterium]